MAEVFGRDSLKSGLLGDEALVDHVDGNVHSGETGALTVAGLQHPELTFFNRELDVLHILEMFFENRADLEKLLVAGRQVLGHLLDWLRSPNTGNDVLTLGIDEILAVENVLAGGGVASESNTSSGSLSGIPEDHCLDVHSRSPFYGNAILLAIDLCAVVLPGREDSVNSATELVHWLLWEVFLRALLDELLELSHDVLESCDGKLGVVVDLLLGFRLVEDCLERIVVLARLLFDAHDDFAIHLKEAAVAVVSEGFVVRLFGESLDDVIVDAEVENRIHHSRH